jgi:hypothetical protein
MAGNVQHRILNLKDEETDVGVERSMDASLATTIYRFLMNMFRISPQPPFRSNRNIILTNAIMLNSGNTQDLFYIDID